MAHTTFKRIVCSLAFLATLPFASLAVADNQPVPTNPNVMNTPIATIPQPQQPTLTATAPNLNTNGYVLMDGASGQIVASKNLDQRMAPASLTKMMTSYIVSAALQSGRIHLTDMVPISQAAWQTGGSKMFVKVGTQVPVKDLMQGIIVDSGNDACVAMAEFIAGSTDSFVSLMNQQAALLGMKGTHFMDVNGLPDPNHYTTPHDIALLARALIYDFPQDYQWYSQKWFAYNGIKQPNRNRLLWRDPTVDGVKTGHTDDAGFCLVASAVRNNTRLISVVMGSPTDEARASNSEALLNYGFRFFETHKLYAANNPITQARVLSGANKQVSVGVLRDVYVAIPTGQFNNLKTTLTLNTPLHAPLKQGQQVGQVNVTLNGSTVTTIPLMTLEANDVGSIWQRMGDKITSVF